MRLIDADALKKIILESCHAKVIDSAPTVMEWVSVEDELPPDDGKHVLILCTETFCGKPWHRYHIANYAHNEGGGFVIGGTASAQHVTHWMPLLPPPEGKHNGL